MHRSRSSAMAACAATVWMANGMADSGRLEPSAAGACVLTLCLDLARARKLRRSHLARFDELLEGTLERLRPAARPRLRHEAAPVRDWLARERPTGNTLVVFSSRASALMAALVLADRVHDYLALGRVADLRPFATITARALVLPV